MLFDLNKIFEEVKSSSMERQYLDLLGKVLNQGEIRSNRTGVDTISLFGERLEFDLNEGFPLLTTKKMAWKSIVLELLWFISGSTDSKVLEEQGVKIWQGNSSNEFLQQRGLQTDSWDNKNKNGDKNYREGDIGPGYGFQWRHFGTEYYGCDESYVGEGVDQLQNAIDLIKHNPESRRILISAWNASDLDRMALPPCHMMMQFYVRTRGNVLDLQMYQRSADLFLGVPFNIASYALLLHIIAAHTNKKPGRLIMIFGDIHIYTNHTDVVRTQLTREPLPTPSIKIDPQCNIDEYLPEHIHLENYNAHERISAPMAV